MVKPRAWVLRWSSFIFVIGHASDPPSAESYVMLGPSLYVYIINFTFWCTSFSDDETNFGWASGLLVIDRLVFRGKILQTGFYLHMECSLVVGVHCICTFKPCLLVCFQLKSLGHMLCAWSAIQWFLWSALLNTSKTQSWSKFKLHCNCVWIVCLLFFLPRDDNVVYNSCFYLELQ